MMSTFAVLAAILAAVGIFGSTGRAIAQRRREVAVRIAIGAKVGELIGSEVRGALLLGVVGIVVGLAGAAWGGRFIGSFLYGAAETRRSATCDGRNSGLPDLGNWEAERLW